MGFVQVENDMPLQKLSGAAIFVPLRDCGFSSLLPYTGQLTLHSHATKLGLRSTSSNATNQDPISDKVSYC